MSLERQIEEVGPSAAGALFRRLMIEEELGYLRDRRTIIGFELDMENNADLAGYTVIALQKHTILAYRSDIHAKTRLILFPTLSMMQDPAFDLLRLNVERKVFKDDSFDAPVQKRGTLKEVAEDLMPTYQDRKISDDTVDQLSVLEKPEPEVAEPVPAHKPREKVLEPPIVDEPLDAPVDTPMDVPVSEPDVPMDEPVDFDGGYDEPPYDDLDAYDAPMDVPPAQDDTPAPEPAESSAPKIEAKEARGKQLLTAQSDFDTLADVSDYVILNLNVGRDIATNVVNLALNSTRDATTQIEVAVLLFVRMFNENKI